MMMPGRNVEYDWSRMGSQGSPKDDEVYGKGNFIDMGDRHLDTRIIRTPKTDAMAAKYPSISPYAYVMNTLPNAIDPDGKQVYMVFNKSTGNLVVIDLDQFKPNLPIKLVQAKDYQLAGIKDDKGNQTYNQALVIGSVFSGAELTSDKVERNLEDSRQVPLPNAEYDVTFHERNSEFYKLDPIDGSRYNDQYDVEGVVNEKGQPRNGFRLHVGSVSRGCVTISRSENAETEFDVLQKITAQTSKAEVPKREGAQKFLPGTTRTKYGTMR